MARTFSPTAAVLSGGQEVTLSAGELQRAHTQEMAREIRKALRGSGGYRSLWPKTRKKRGKARRNPPSIGTFTVQARVSKGRAQLRVGQKQRHGRLLETRETIRGYINVHHEAALRTIELNWDVLEGIALSRALQRARSNRIRKIHARHRAAQRAAAAAAAEPF